jgi:hypothetical protein
MIETPFPFPISSYQDVFKIQAVPAIDGTKISHTVITETSYPEGNSTRKVESYTVTVYDATGRLNSYLFGYNHIDRLV